MLLKEAKEILRKNGYTLLYESGIDITEYSDKEIADLMRDMYNDCEKGTNPPECANDWYDLFDMWGYDASDLSPQKINDLADIALNDDDDDDDDETLDTSEAKSWLNNMLRKYGNTKYFPSDVTKKLNDYIEKFGNTYYW